MSRNTLRKRIIRSVLSERGAMLLDELRWLVLERELGGKLRVISDAQTTSFARTVRDYMPVSWFSEFERQFLGAKPFY